jgi:NhaA family Na+:H+ antiporter
MVVIDALRDFFRLQAASGIILVLAAVAALILANSPLSHLYDQFLALPGAVIVGSLEIRKPLLLWLNDGWMAIFFFLVGLEIKRELVEGELSDQRAAILPIIGALGGMIVPTVIYGALNWHNDVALRGWAIPSATDIAFALGVMALLGPKVPPALKLLLTAIAIIDDLGAIIIIAVFYTADLSLGALGLAAAAIVGLAILNRAGVRHIIPYGLLGAVMWVCVLKSGVHATLAGVITALFIPLAEKDGYSPSRDLEHALHPWVAYLVLPAFAFANAGVSFAGIGIRALADSVTLGVALGLLVGKTIGVWGAVQLATATRFAKIPAGVGQKHILGLAVLCGIGFTMSLFIGGLAFDDSGNAVSVRLGVLMGSTAAAAIGYFLLRAAGGSEKSTAAWPSKADVQPSDRQI